MAPARRSPRRLRSSAVGERVATEAAVGPAAAVPDGAPGVSAAAPAGPPAALALTSVIDGLAEAVGAEAVAVFERSDGGHLGVLGAVRRPADGSGQPWSVAVLAEAAEWAWRAAAADEGSGPAPGNAPETGLAGLAAQVVTVAALPDGSDHRVGDLGGPAPVDRSVSAEPSVPAAAVLVHVLGEPVGVLVVAAVAPDPATLQRAGEQVATVLALRQLEQVERRHRLGMAHARRHLTLLVQAGDALADAVGDLGPALGALGEVVVPMFADWFAVDLLPDEAGTEAGTERVVSSGDGALGGVARCTGAVHHRHPEGDRLVAAVMERGRSEMVVRRPPEGGQHLPGPELGKAGPAGSAESMLVVPVRVRGTVVGAASFVTGAGRRGYRLSDLRVAEDLAERIGVTVERVRLWHARQRAALAAEANQRRLHAVVDASPLAIVELDSSGEPSWWNPAARRLLGWPSPAGVGADPIAASADDPPPVSGDALRLLWAEACAGDPVAGRVVRAARADGAIAHLSVSSARLREPDGAPAGALAMIEDVTERQRMIDRVHQAERLQAMARLAGSVAHDFNNLLTVVLGSCDVLLGRMGEQGPLAEEVRAIRTAGQRAADLTSQLLSIGQRRPLQPVEVDPEAVLVAMQPVLARVLGDDVVVEQRTAGPPARVLVEPAELERAVLNLALNARDAMPQGGSMTLGTRHRPTGPDGAGVVDVWVQDTGLGMDPHTAARCFEPFFTTKPRGSGTGLGLVGVHAFVSAAGGTVAVDSAPGAGTTFTMTLPATVPGGSEPGVVGHTVGIGLSGDVAAAEDDPEGESVVLVVDDDPRVRRLVVQTLVHHGMLVVEAAGADEALDAVAAATGRLALVITDVSMPGMGGRELAARLVAGAPALPVLYMTGDEAAAGLAAGADVLTKPFGGDELVARVRRAIGSPAG